MPPESPPSSPPVGGQALLGGVMMRRGAWWGAAVRLPDGTIVTTTRPVPSPLVALRRVVLLRGVVALVETVLLGVSAMMWAARTRDPTSRAYRGPGAAVAVLVGVTVAVGGFGVLPAVVGDLVAPGGTLAFNVVETVVRLALIVAYLWLLGRSSEVQEVLAYHGAEHQVVNAVEAGEAPTVEAARGRSRIHTRCGTTFLLLLVAVAFVVHLAIGRPDLWILAISRVVLLPVIAAVSYELIRGASARPQRRWAVAVSAPGRWLQQVTTAPASVEHLEVAVAAMRAAPAASTEPTGPLVGAGP